MKWERRQFSEGQIAYELRLAGWGRVAQGDHCRQRRQSSFKPLGDAWSTGRGQPSAPCGERNTLTFRAGYSRIMPHCTLTGVQAPFGDDRIRLSLLAVDTHGYTSAAMAVAKLLGFDLCPRLRDLAERKLLVPRNFEVPQGLEAVTMRRVSLAAIERGWDELLRLAASIRSGRVSASLALQRFGSAAQGNRGESVHQLQRTIYSSGSARRSKTTGSVASAQRATPLGSSAAVACRDAAG